MTPKKKTVSASSLATYLACPQRYFRTYEMCDEPRRGQANADMIAGTGVHAALEHAIKAALGGEPATIESAIDAGLSAVVAEFQQHKPTTDALAATNSSFLLDSCLTRVKATAGWYLDNHLGSLSPEISEHRILLPIPGTDWHLDARMDLIETDGSVIDFKLTGSKRSPAMNKGDISEQLSVYALARLLETGHVPPSLALEYICDGKLTREVARRVTTRSESDCARTLARIQCVIACIEKDVYPPTSREGIECNGDRCRFWLECPYGAGRA